ncbi:hypothetical protein EV207_14517 [Scopulibacillus darangshiensis]|uniref:Uncharacterized protein n=1 Tax=Scopulibacillus darangshiensis TaxID=442528 RepID=A0A4R2NI78_9BACL|nr:hypothetical protein EV207_14517 [Scopulibacillus darangshiensis]
MVTADTLVRVWGKSAVMWKSGVTHIGKGKLSIF